MNKSRRERDEQMK